MAEELRGVATASIKPGDLVLCRNFKVSPAEGGVGNAIARAMPKWRARWEDFYEEGSMVLCDPFVDWTPKDLQAIADGPIMDGTRLYLPAGRITERELQQRTFEQFLAAGIPDDERP